LPDGITFGFEVKPQVCKEFPYYFMETPDGVVVGLSFACGSVRNFKGSLLAEKEEEIRHVLAGSYRVKQFPANLELYSGIPLPWEEYKLLEESLLAIIHNKNQTFPELCSRGIPGHGALSLKQVEIQLKPRAKPPKRLSPADYKSFKATNSGHF
jgi:hypothetical protein